MQTLLAITVGGSCAPVVTAIKDYQPDFVVFIASSGPKGSRVTIDGAGNPCGDARKIKCPKCNQDIPLGNPEGANILAQSGLNAKNCFIFELTDPDDLPHCYTAIRATLLQVRGERTEWRALADYTGGTKTMTAALAIVALELGWELSIVRGNRTDLQKVRDGTEMSSLVNTWEVRARQQIEKAEDLFNQHAYASAGHLVEALARSAPFSPALQQEIQRFVTLCRGFDAWDRFDHARAGQILASYQSEIVPQWKFLKVLNGQMKGTGFEPVFDLVLNAERRAGRGRYDDAVARLYRALEMLAQIRLKQRQPSLDSSDLDPGLLPEGVRTAYEARTGKIKLGLQEDYDLLAALEDPLGAAFTPERQKMLHTLEKRNASILAHGIQPCDERIYQEMHAETRLLLDKGLQALNIRRESSQFPRLQKGKIIQPQTPS